MTARPSALDRIDWQEHLDVDRRSRWRALILAIVVGAWAVVSGVGEVFAAVRLLRYERRGGLLLLAGLLWVVAGVLILVWPVSGAFVLALLIGASAVLYGIVLAALALMLRSAAQSAPSSA